MNEVPENYVSVTLNVEGPGAPDTVVGYVEDMVLTLYAEGRIKNMPVLTVENGKLVIVYYPTESMANLRAFPASMEQLERSTPDDTPGMLDEIEGATERMEPTLPVVPVAGDNNADQRT